MTADIIAMEEELKAAGWQPLAVHPNSPVWKAPDGTLYPGVGYAWLILQEQRLNNNNG